MMPVYAILAAVLGVVCIFETTYLIVTSLRSSSGGIPSESDIKKAILKSLKDHDDYIKIHKGNAFPGFVTQRALRHRVRENLGISGFKLCPLDPELDRLLREHTK